MIRPPLSPASGAACHGALDAARSRRRRLPWPAPACWLAVLLICPWTAGAAPAPVSDPTAPAAAAAAAAAPSAAGGDGADQGAGAGEALTRAWRASGDAADLKSLELGGATVLVPYGHTRPVVRCAPLRACAIQLEEAETLLATATGDSERWLVQTAASGPGARTPLVLVKPTACDVSTNLVIATDRRVYEVSLDSPPCREPRGAAQRYNPRLPYTGLLRFYYPEDLVRRWADAERAAAAAQAAAAADAARAPAALAPGVALSQLNFDYRWRRDRGFPWTPSQVFDDGEHTYILLPDAARHAEAPALLAAQPDGSLALLNYRLEQQAYVTDRVVDRAVLVIGDGAGKGHRQQLEIVNHAAGRQRPRRTADDPAATAGAPGAAGAAGREE